MPLQHHYDRSVYNIITTEDIINVRLYALRLVIIIITRGHYHFGIVRAVCVFIAAVHCSNTPSIRIIFYLV